MYVDQRLAPAVECTCELAIVRDIPDIYFMCRRVGSAYDYQRDVIRQGPQDKILGRSHTTRKPLSIWTERHRMPCHLVDRIIEAVSWLKFNFYIFPSVVRWRIYW